MLKGKLRHQLYLICSSTFRLRSVIYDKNEYLTLANKQGVSPMVYLRTMYRDEWENFMERMGVSSEGGAWMASKDGFGRPCSGELETRMWASMRGQTLARCINGVMEYAKGVRLLAWLQASVVE
jgi:callose synthase